MGKNGTRVYAERILSINPADSRERAAVGMHPVAGDRRGTMQPVPGVRVQFADDSGLVWLGVVRGTVPDVVDRLGGRLGWVDVVNVLLDAPPACPPNRWPPEA